MRHTIENSALLIEVEDHGAELVRIWDKEKQTEVLWDGKPEYWARRAPLLFPNVGRHYRDTYRAEGKEWPSHQHGFARDMEFTCVEETADTLSHQLLSDETTRARYPWDFVLRVTHSLQGRRLTVSWEVKNPGGETMYFTIGGHPAFRVPAEKPPCPGGEDYRQYQLCFPGKETLSYLLVDREGCGTIQADEPHSLTLHEGTVPLAELKDGEKVLAQRFFDLDALVFDGGQFDAVELRLPDGTPYVRMEAPGFPNFGIWAAPGAPFVCLEPWMGRADDYGFTKDLTAKPWINALEPAGTFRKRYSIEIL